MAAAEKTTGFLPGRSRRLSEPSAHPCPAAGRAAAAGAGEDGARPRCAVGGGSPPSSPPRRGKRRLPLTPRPLRPPGKDQSQHRDPHLPPPQLPTSASRARTGTQTTPTTGGGEGYKTSREGRAARLRSPRMRPRGVAGPRLRSVPWAAAFRSVSAGGTGLGRGSWLPVPTRAGPAAWGWLPGALRGVAACLW